MTGNVIYPPKMPGEWLERTTAEAWGAGLQTTANSEVFTRFLLPSTLVKGYISGFGPLALVSLLKSIGYLL